MIHGLCLDRGHGRAERAAYRTLAYRLADHARAAGLRLDRLLCSREPGSRSHYLCLSDRLGRGWKIRISDHLRPIHTCEPHLDLVSRDGRSGFDEAAAQLTAIAAGTVAWFDARDPVRHVATARPTKGRRA